MYTSSDVAMWVQDKYTTLITRAWNEEYLYLQMHDASDATNMLLSKEQAEILRDTLDVFLEGGFDDE